MSQISSLRTSARSLFRSRGASLLASRVPALLLVLLFGLGASDCGQTANRVLDSMNDLQDAAGHALLEAKAQTEAAGLKCGQLARIQVPPVTPSPEACEALGSPLPFDPVKVNKAISYSNGAHEAIRAANAVKKAVKAGTTPPEGLAESLSHVIVAVQRLYRASQDLGVRLDYAGAEKALADAKGATR
jgi:hypothetical protein